MAVVRGGMMRRLLVAVLSVAIPALLTLLATSTPASAATRGAELTAGCTGSWQGRPGGRDILVIDCQPGFASAHDRIYVYPRSAGQHGTTWQDDLNMSDAVWLFDPGARNHPSLIVDFHRASQGLVADVYDDQDGDGKVEYRLMNGLPVPAETSFPTIHVVASDGWWIKDGKINYNLDIDVDGPVRVAFGSELYADLTRTDGAIDYRIQVRDEQDRGRPDWELIQAYPPLDESHGVVRSLLMVSTHGDLPITDYIFWPLLGVGGGTGEAERYSYGIVKDYNTSFAPIQVDWLAGKVQSVGELVASRGSASNWFVYSMSPLTGTATYADFENPFAFYDLAGKNDGHPDLQIRSQYFGPSDPYGPTIDQPSEVVRYSWDQRHEHSWTYKVDLLGRNPINSLVHFPGLAVKTIPYQE
ncbi:MAG TPA: hypothetical protein VK457_23400, partial [Chloroflexota bacterium]|nr:hypothetical protein [Chloroflexota bacterium]